MMDLCVSEIATAAGIELVQVEPLTGGEQGALEVVDSAGNHFVLKTHPSSEMLARFKYAAATTESLRQENYPAPRYFATGATSTASFALIEKLDGKPDQPVSSRLFEQLISLNRKQCGRADDPNPDWISGMVDSLVHGCAGFCDIDSLKYHSSKTNDLLRRLQAIPDRSRHVEVNCEDIVHFDFHPANVLSTNDVVTAIIDWDGTCIGDGSFDLATLLFYCWDDENARPELTREIVRRSGHHALSLYLAHVILRQVDWSIRHHDTPTVEHYLVRSVRVLRAVERNG